MVTCPLAPSTSHLISSSCSSPRRFGLGFLQTSPRDNALALLLTFGSANTWWEDFHLPSFVPCPAHTSELSGAALAASGGGPKGRNVLERLVINLVATGTTRALTANPKIGSIGILIVAPFISKRVVTMRRGFNGGKK